MGEVFCVGHISTEDILVDLKLYPQRSVHIPIPAALFGKRIFADLTKLRILR